MGAALDVPTAGDGPGGGLPRQFGFVAHKVHIHRWPADTPRWSGRRTGEIGLANADRKPRDVEVRDTTVRVGAYTFDSLCKVGITVPLFKRECTVIFEGRCEEFYAHVHVTTRSADYADTFDRLTRWRRDVFPDAYYLD